MAFGSAPQGSFPSLLPLVSAAAISAAGVLSPLSAAVAGVTITSYGHSALMIKGGGVSVLLNPFKAVGCAAGLTEPRLGADLILVSSRLKDEGADVASGRLLSKPGSYKLAGLNIEGVASPHDRLGGRRFGQSTLWRWTQAGLEFAHLGGTAGPLSPAHQVLLGRPDVLIIGVGGGAKVFTGQEAAEVVRELQPRRVIPVQYNRGNASDHCDQGPLDPFLGAMAGTKVVRSGRSISIGSGLGDATVINVLR